MIGIIAVIAVIALFALIMGVSDLFLAKNRENQKRAGKRIQRLQKAAREAGSIDIERRRSMSTVPWLNRALSARGWTKRLDLMLEQGQTNINVSTLVLIAVIAGTATFYLLGLFSSNVILNMLPTVMVSYAPFFWANRRRKKRMAKFQRQLPDALDLIARALKAGHAFPQGMRMVADEFEDPIGPEFEKTIDEVNFGISTDIALLNLTRRVACPDLKFFVVSVNIQRETGGNLAEIVGNITSLVRDRFKLEGKVKVLAAEGKLTAYVLLALPIAVSVAITLINPEYMSELQDTELGRKIMTGAIVWMSIGAVILKRMTTIKV